MSAAGLGLEGRAVVVTGAAGGLGRSYVAALSCAGASVVANDCAVDGAGRFAVDDLAGASDRSAPGPVMANHDSVTTRSGGRAIVECCLDTFGRIDGVVANAGVMRRGRYGDWDEDDVTALIDVHLLGSLWVTQAAYSAMAAAGFGRILFTASSAGLYGHPRGALYAAVKGAVVGLMRSLAQETDGDRIRVNAVAPFAATAMTEGQWPAGLAERFAPDRVAPVVAYLVSEACGFHGEVLTVGGGTVARSFTSTTRGWRAPDQGIVAVGAHLAEIVDQRDSVVPAGVADEFRLLAGPEEGSIAHGQS